MELDDDEFRYDSSVSRFLRVPGGDSPPCMSSTLAPLGRRTARAVHWQGDQHQPAPLTQRAHATDKQSGAVSNSASSNDLVDPKGSSACQPLFSSRIRAVEADCQQCRHDVQNALSVAEGASRKAQSTEQQLKSTLEGKVEQLQNELTVYRREILAKLQRIDEAGAETVRRVQHAEQVSEQARKYQAISIASLNNRWEQAIEVIDQHFAGSGESKQEPVPENTATGGDDESFLVSRLLEQHGRQIVTLKHQHHKQAAEVAATQLRFQELERLHQQFSDGTSEEQRRLDRILQALLQPRIKGQIADSMPSKNLCGDSMSTATTSSKSLDDFGADFSGQLERMASDFKSRLAVTENTFVQDLKHVRELLSASVSLTKTMQGELQDLRPRVGSLEDQVGAWKGLGMGSSTSDDQLQPQQQQQPHLQPLQEQQQVLLQQPQPQQYHQRQSSQHSLSARASSTETIPPRAVAKLVDKYESLAAAVAPRPDAACTDPVTMFAKLQTWLHASPEQQPQTASLTEREPVSKTPAIATAATVASSARVAAAAAATTFTTEVVTTPSTVTPTPRSSMPASPVICSVSRLQSGASSARSKSPRAPVRGASNARSKSPGAPVPGPTHGRHTYPGPAGKGRVIFSDEAEVVSTKPLAVPVQVQHCGRSMTAGSLTARGGPECHGLVRHASC